MVSFQKVERIPGFNRLTLQASKLRPESQKSAIFWFGKLKHVPSPSKFIHIPLSPQSLPSIPPLNPSPSPGQSNYKVPVISGYDSIRKEKICCCLKLFSCRMAELSSMTSWTSWNNWDLLATTPGFHSDKCDIFTQESQDNNSIQK